MAEPVVPIETPGGSENPASAIKLEDLPPRLLGRILSFIPTNDHVLLKEVSPGWKKLIDEHIGVPAYIGKPSDFKSDRLDFSPVNLMTEIGISILHLINVHNTVLPDYKFPNLVKQISFVDYISEKNFLRALRELTNLRHMTIDMSTCHYLEFHDISLDFLVRLETLAFTSGEYCSEWNEEVNPSKNEVDITLENLFSLLTKNHFRSLKCLLLGVPIITPVSGNYKFATSLFNCALTHHATLRHIEVFFDGKLEGVVQTPTEAATATATIDIDYEALIMIQLHDLFVNLHEFHRNHGILDIWLRLLNSQKFLKRCIFIPRGGDEDECVELALPDSFLLRNPSVSTLVVFKWFVAEAEPGQVGLTIDLSVFHKCTVLADINLTSNGNNPSNLINVHRLPISIQRVCVEGIRVRTDDIDNLASDFPSLTRLSLTGVGEENNFGMDIQTLRGIYERKTLTRLLVFDGFNKMSIRVISQQEESSFSFLVMLLKTKFYEGDSYFQMKLCENGEYAVIQ